MSMSSNPKVSSLGAYSPTTVKISRRYTKPSELRTRHTHTFSTRSSNDIEMESCQMLQWTVLVKKTLRQNLRTDAHRLLSSCLVCCQCVQNMLDSLYNVSSISFLSFWIPCGMISV